MDFRYPSVEAEESAGNVTLCMYICDGELKRNASFTFATEDYMANCEWYTYINGRSHVTVCSFAALNCSSEVL